MTKVLVVGAGMGGLAAAADLARQGCEVTLLERREAPGGKIRQVVSPGPSGSLGGIDAGPTVLTMRWVFEELFADAGVSFAEALHCDPAGILARHAWMPRRGEASARLDLHADLERTVAAIGAFAGPAEAKGYRAFCARAGEIFATLDAPFIRRQRPRLDQLVADAGRSGLGGLARLSRISPFETLMKALAQHFRDPRLRQLFGRYATYCGSSPYLAPATLMLVAHVERAGVWLPRGGMLALARAVAALAGRQGAQLRYGAGVRRIETARGVVTGVTLDTNERLDADAVVLNADVAALTSGLFGEEVRASAPATAQRSLSAVTFAMAAEAEGFPLVRHNVFFSRDYPAEFEAIFKRGRVPDEPTVYVCAQDRADGASAGAGGPERLLCLVNAPADGRALDEAETARCEQAMRRVLTGCGLHLTTRAQVVTDPAGFAALFPATGGALYGPASHGWQASFQRSGAKTKVPGLYLAGGSVHPGPGVPMAAMSGRLAAAALLADRPRASRPGASISAASMPPSRGTATPGGMSTR